MEKQKEAWHKLRAQVKINTVTEMSETNEKQEGILEESTTKKQREENQA